MIPNVGWQSVAYGQPYLSGGVGGVRCITWAAYSEYDTLQVWWEEVSASESQLQTL